MVCSVMAGDWGWRKERYPLHAMFGDQGFQAQNREIFESL
jgi:hypothetical protein